MIALRFWREGVMAALLIALGVTWMIAKANDRRADKWQERSVQTKAAFDQTVTNYRAAAEKARAEDAANKARVEAAQDRITKEVSGDYQKQLAALRARYDALRLRSNATSGNLGSSGGPAVSSLPDAASGAYGASTEDRLPAPDALIASEQALQLQALQDWVRGQTEVER